MKKNDWILISIVLLIAVAGFGVQLLLPSDAPESVVITVDGISKGRYSLYEGRTIRLDCGNTIRIRNQEVWMQEADCPDQYCVRQGRVKTAGQSIICLPHKVIVEIIEE